MALPLLRLRRALFLSSSLLRHQPQLNLSKAISTLHSNPFPSSNLDAENRISTFHSQLPCFRFFRSSPVFLSTRRQYQGPQDDQEIGPDTILFEGCDYNHWLITIDFPKDKQLTAEEMVETYVQTAAKVFGSVEEAKKRIYACSTTTYQGFQVECSEETSEKFKDIPGVVFVLPDSYIDPVNKEYGGDKYINGTIIHRPPPIQYRNNPRPRNRRYDDRGQMQGDTRNFNPSQQNYGPPRGLPSQQNYGPPQGPATHQNYGPQVPPSQPNYGLPQGSPSQQNYSPVQGSPFQQSYGPPHGPPAQQNYGQAPPQQNYGPLQGGPSQQNYASPRGPPHQQNYGLNSYPTPQPNNKYLPHQQNYDMQQAPAPQQNYGQPQNLPHQQNFSPEQNFSSQQRYDQQRSTFPAQQNYGIEQSAPATPSGGWNQYQGGKRDFHHGDQISHGYPGQRSFNGQSQSYISTQGENASPGLGGTQGQEVSTPYDENCANNADNIHEGRQVVDQENTRVLRYQ